MEIASKDMKEYPDKKTRNELNDTSLGKSHLSSGDVVIGEKSENESLLAKVQVQLSNACSNEGGCQLGM